jgi:hypothetical protein
MDRLLGQIDAAVLVSNLNDEAEALKSWPQPPLPMAIIAPVVTALGEVPELKALCCCRQLSLGEGTGREVTPMFLASALVRRSKNLGNSKEAVQELLDLIRSNVLKGRIIVVLAGVEVKEVVQLTSDVALVPLSNLQPPAWIEKTLKEQKWPLSHTFEPVEPKAALVAHVRCEPLFISAGQSGAPFPLTELDALRKTVSCIAVACGYPTAIFKVWLESADPRLPLASPGIAYTEPRWGNSAAAMHEIDAECVRATVLSYNNFKGSKDSLDTALERLASASGGWRREDRVTDLGIALESALMYAPSANLNDNNEISYKLGTRAAWLMGIDPANRLAIFKQIRRLYGFRSQAAHSGKVKVTATNWQAIDDEIEQGITLGRSMVVALMKRGGWPNWDNLVMGET